MVGEGERNKEKERDEDKTSLCVERDGCSAGSHKFGDGDPCLSQSAHLTNLYLACK